MFGPRHFPLLSRQVARILELARGNSTFNREILELLKRLRAELQTSMADGPTSSQISVETAESRPVDVVRPEVVDFFKNFEIDGKVPSDILTGLALQAAAQAEVEFEGNTKSADDIYRFFDRHWKAISPHKQTLILCFQPKFGAIAPSEEPK